jgi:serine/threonine-protein kinase
VSTTSVRLDTGAVMEPTEMSDVVAEAETQAVIAWALTDVEDLATQRLTPRRITALALAVSLVLIAVAGVVALRVLAPAEPSEPVAAPPPLAVLDGTYQLVYDSPQSTVMGSPNSPSETQSTSEMHWAAFRSTCTSTGCTATSTGLDDKTHTVADTPSVTRQWHFVNGQWVTSPDRERSPMDDCSFDDEGNPKAGADTISHTKWLEPQPDGTLRGMLSMTTVSSECGREGGVHRIPLIATRIGDVPPGVVVADPSTVPPPNPIPPAVAGPVLDGTYRLDFDSLNATYSDGARNPSTANFSRWYAYQSRCAAAGCVATEANLDEANHQEATGLAGVHYFIDGHWIYNGSPARIPCDPNRRGGKTTAEETVVLGTDLVPQPDGTLRGISTITFKSNECGEKGSVITTPVVATRTGPVSPNVVLADPCVSG